MLNVNLHMDLQFFKPCVFLVMSSVKFPGVLSTNRNYDRWHSCLYFILLMINHFRYLPSTENVGYERDVCSDCNLFRLLYPTCTVYTVNKLAINVEILLF